MLLILAALLIGVSLGVFSSGGSILTVPLLVYIADQEPKVAIASALIVVGSICFISTIVNLRRLTISWRHVVLFGLPSAVGIVFGTYLAIYVSGSVQLLTFGLVMLLAVRAMWKSNRTEKTQTTEQHNILITLYGILVGIITGFVGVGGGFLIVPALAIFAGLSFNKAAATSLVIITINSFVGFTKYQSVLKAHELSIDWHLVIILIIAGTLGSFSGNKLTNKFPQEHLSKGFSVFLLFMATFTIYQSLIKLTA